MPVRADPPLTTFASGVLSPKLLGREDIKQYGQGLLDAANLIVMPHGGLTRRPGTAFVAEVKDSADTCRLIPFQYSTEQAYVIEAGDQYFRFYLNDGRLEDPPGTPVELTTPWTHDELADLQWAQTADVMYIVHPSYMPRKLTRTSLTSFSLSTVSFGRARAPLLPLNQNPDNYATITGTWPNLTVTMAQATFVAGDVGRTLYVRSTIDKNAYYMVIVGFTSATVVTATGLDRFSTTAGHPSGEDADRWAFGAMDATHGCRAVCFHEGRLAYGGFARAPDMVQLSVSDDFDNYEIESPDAATTNAENDDKSIQRRCISGQVNTVQWMASGTSDLIIGTTGAEFRLKPANDDILTPLSSSLKRTTQRGADAVPPIVVDSSLYFIDRSGAVLRRLGFDITQDSLVAQDLSILSEHLLLDGVWEMAYTQSPNPTLWLALTNGRLVGWSVEREQEVSAAHPHILGGHFSDEHARVESLAVIPNGNQPVLGAPGNEDQLWLCVKRTINGATKRYIEYLTHTFRARLPASASQIERQTAVEFARFVDSSLPLASPVTIEGISSASPAVVTRTAHGLTSGNTIRIRHSVDAIANGMAHLFEARRFTVQVLSADTFIPVDVVTGAAVDTTGLTFSSAVYYRETSTLSGLGHLEGETVAILADGKVHPPRVVTSGSVTLDYPASVVYVGLPYPTYGETMPVLGGAPRGSSRGYPQQFGQVAVQLFETLGGEYGRGSNPRNWEPLIFESAADLTDYPPALFTGVRTLALPGSAPDDLPTLRFRQEQPLPFTLLALYPRTWTNVD